MRRPIPATHHINFFHGKENLCENFVAMAEFWQRRNVARKSNWFFGIKFSRGGPSLLMIFLLPLHSTSTCDLLFNHTHAINFYAKYITFGGKVYRHGFLLKINA